MMLVQRVLASCALAVLLTSCDSLPPIFEDVGADPHPPRLALLGIGLGTPEPPPETETDSQRSVTYLPPDTVVTVRPYETDANTIALRVAYADAGADLTAITVRDTSGPNAGDFELPEFPGTSGILESSIAFDPNTVPGPHRMELWATDGKESRSDKIVFTVVVESY